MANKNPERILSDIDIDAALLLAGVKLDAAAEKGLEITHAVLTERGATPEEIGAEIAYQKREYADLKESALADLRREWQPN